MKVNRAGLADVLSVALTTIDRYVKDGMPADYRPDKSRSQEWQFDTKNVIDWLVERQNAKETGATLAGGEVWADARARDRAATANLRELELRTKLGEMVSVKDVADRVATEYAIVKSRMQAIPGRVSQLVATESDAEAIERLLKDEVHKALKALSDE